MKKPGKYKRQVPSYRPELRWRQTICDVVYLACFYQAWDKVQASGRREPIKGYGGWYVANSRDDLQ